MPAREAGRLRRAAARFRANRPAMAGLVLLAALVLIALLGPSLWRYGYADITPDLSQSPSLAHPLGTDTLGHDMLAQAMRGLQQSLLIAFAVALIAGTAGTLLGVIAGYYGGTADAALMRVVDLVLTIPVIALAAFLGHNLGRSGVSWAGVALVLGALFWTRVARLVRAVTLRLARLPFIRAAELMGASTSRILLRHLVPNVADQVIVATTLLVGVAILSETGLSFLGFGVRSPDTSLGLLVANAQNAVLSRPWLFYAPGLLIIAVVLSVNYVGEGLRDALNPQAEPISALSPPPAVVSPARPADPDDPQALVELRGLSIRFPGSPAAAVDDVSLGIGRGEALALIGESGSGKSLTAAAITGLLPPTARRAGTVRFAGRPLEDLSFAHWRTLRGRRIAVILQDPSTSLNPVLSIGAHFAESLRAMHPATRTESDARAIALMTQLGIREPEARLRQYPHELSGGMRQRVVIALAILHRPDLIIADEPTTALDVTVQAQVLDALRLAREATGAALLFISHDLALVAGLADRIAVMEAGRLVEVAPVDRLFAAPAHPYTQRLLSRTRRLDRLPARSARPPAAAGPPPLLSVHNLTRDFARRGGGAPLRALDGVSFDMAPGESVGIVGESGSGKTTLLNAILGLHRPTAGRVVLDGTDLTAAPAARRRAALRGVGIVFQDPYTSLDPRMTVAEALAEPLRIAGETDGLPARLRQAVERVQLPAASLGRFPHEFSGGQRQRIAIARALMLSPRLVVLDEPVSALDVSIQHEVMLLLKTLRAEMGVAYLMVAHDLALVADFADRIGVMLAGRMVEIGPAAEIVARPRQDYTRRLIEAVPIPDPPLERARLERVRRAAAAVG